MKRPINSPGYPGLIRKHRQIQVRKHIPADVQDLFPHKLFRTTLKTSDMAEAYILSRPIVAEWDNRIAQARSTQDNAVQREILRLCAAYEHYRGGKPFDAAGIALVNDFLAFLFRQMGGVTPAVQRLVLAHAKGDVEQALQAVHAAPQVTHAIKQVVGLAQPMTPFLDMIEQFEAKVDLPPRTARTYALTVRDFAKDMAGDKAARYSLESITDESVQQWVEQRRETERQGTLNNRVAALRKYWDFLCHHKVGGLTRKAQRDGPFHHCKFVYTRRAHPKPPLVKLAFAAEDVTKLWDAALARCDAAITLQDIVRMGRPPSVSNADALLHCIIIAAYTGMRLGAICNIRVTDIDSQSGIRIIHVLQDKSAAGKRDVPIHSALAPLIDWLIAHAGPDGYLVTTWRDKYGRGGNAISHDFGKLRTELGFGPEYTEHCLRRTVENQMEEAGVTLKTLKVLIGHTIPEITIGIGYGKYGSLPPLTERRDAIEAIRYPHLPPQMGQPKRAQ